MKKEQRLLAEMASIGRMCRGKVSVRRQGKSGGEYFGLFCKIGHVHSGLRHGVAA